MKERMSKQYDIIKVFATILVVVGHATRMYTGKGLVIPSNSSSALEVITNIIYSFHMPLYMCVTGMVYGMCIDDFGKYNDTLPFIGNKARRLLIPYIFFAFFYVAPVMTLFHFTSSSYLDFCLSEIISPNNARHLWFISTLFIIFVLFAVFRKIAQRLHWAIVLAMLAVLSWFSYAVPSVLGLNSVCKYILYFYIGYLFNRYKEKLAVICKNPFVLIGLLIVYIASYLYVPPRVPIAAIAAIGVVFGLVQYVSLSICDTKIFSEARKNGFGIFLFHPMIIYIIYYYFGSMDINPFILCGLTIIAAYAVSYLLTVAFRKLKLNILIGE